MIEIKIEGRTDGTTANATIAVDLDPNMKEYHEHYNFEFSIDSLDPNRSTFWYKCEPLFNIRHSTSTSPLSKTEELNLYDRNHEGKITRLVETRMSGTTILPDNHSKFSKKLKNPNRIKGYKIKRNCYTESSFSNGKRFKCILTNDNNPFLKYVEFKLLPEISSEVVPSRYEGINHQLISVDRSIIAEVENHEIVGLKFLKLGKHVEVSHSGDDAFGSTIVKNNGKIIAIHQSKQIGYITTNGNGGASYKTLADGNDEYEFAISGKAMKLTWSIMKHDEEMKNAIERAVNVAGYDVNIYHIKGDQSNMPTKEYFYLTNHSSIWALYRAETRFDKKLNDYVAQPIKIAYENLKECGADHYSYKRTYFGHCGEHVYSQIVEDDSDYTRYTIETEDFKVFCRIDNPLLIGDRKYIVKITRNTGGSGYLSSIIKRFDAIHTHGSNNYIRAIESLISHNHPGESEPLGIFRYLKMIEDICKNPHDAMRHSWSSTFVDTANTLGIVDIDLLLNPGDTISWAKLILWAEERYKSDPSHEELTLLDRIVWEDFMLPSSMEYKKEERRYTGAKLSDDTVFEESGKDDDDKVDVDEDEIPTASNACEAMYMDN